jgi:hypothetical protein
MRSEDGPVANRGFGEQVELASRPKRGNNLLPTGIIPRRAKHLATLHNRTAPAYNGQSDQGMLTMRTRLLTISLPVVFAGVAVMHAPVHADVYTWVDKSGSINVSNIAPPDGVQVTSVVHANPEANAAREAAAREVARQAEVQALADRVRQLEGEVRFASMQAPPSMPPAQYWPAPQMAPPVVQYVADPAPPTQYASYASPWSGYGCDGLQYDCGLWGVPAVYVPSVIVVRAPGFRHPPFHDGRPGIMHPDPHQAAHQPPRMTRTVSRG